MNQRVLMTDMETEKKTKENFNRLQMNQDLSDLMEAEGRTCSNRGGILK